jgi:2-phospho-L-lactate guanylyltransferase (CobY/MobA/RfbA family)
VDRSATPGRLVALVPVRGLEGGKSRLGEALDAEERRALVERLLARTVVAAAATRGVAAVAVVSPDEAVLDLAVRFGAAGIAQHGDGLNAGLAEGQAWAEAAGADGIIVLPVDLPAVSSRELGRLVGAARAALAAPPAASAGPGLAPGAVVVLVPDRAGSGTNVLLVAPPGVIPFRFGEGSRTSHAGAARDAGAAYVELEGPLALDLDTPEDLLAAEAAGLGGVRVDLP